MSRKIGISVLCFGIKGLSSGPVNVYKKALSYGADGIQLLPIWFWKETEIRRLPKNAVISYEGAWNNGYFIQTFNWKRLKRDKGKNIIFDLGLFWGVNDYPQARIELFQELYPKAITFNTNLANSVVETKADEPAWWKEGDFDLVVDIYHVLWICKLDPNAAIKLIKQVAHRAVCIHLQCQDKDYLEGYLEDFFAGKGYLYDALSILMSNGKKDAPVIIEIPEGNLNKKHFTMENVIKQVRLIDKNIG